MSNVTDLGTWRSIDERLQQLEKRESQGDLKAGGGGGTSDGMEQRVAKLETEVSDLKKQVTDMRVENAKAFGDVKTVLATIDERTKHLPSRFEVVGIVALIVGVLGGAIGIAVRFIPG
jgi:uncharacterized protein (UPF0335 family)